MSSLAHAIFTHRAARAILLVIALVSLVGCQHARAPVPSGPSACDERAWSPGLGAVSELEEKDIRGMPVAQVEEVFEGRVPGAQVIRLPGGGISVLIRGRGTISGDGEPLYVVDGMLINHSPGRGLDWLNPGDIRQIRVLKDASETSFYGMRGANGVILITTKRGRCP